MATGEGPGSADLTHYAQLAANPQRYHLFQALRIIEAQHGDRPRLGQSRRSAQDPVRLGQEAELAFPTSTIAEFGPDKQGQMRLTNRSFGLFGPQGPLPLHLTEYARNRRRNERDTTFIAFADMLYPPPAGAVLPRLGGGSAGAEFRPSRSGCLRAQGGGAVGL